MYKSRYEAREERVNKVIAEVCKGKWNNVSVDFNPFKDIKLKWTRTPSSFVLHLSDYLVDAPDEVIVDMTEFLLGRIYGENVSYPDTLRAYMTAPEFAQKNQQTYLARCGSIGSHGMHIDLDKSVKRLEGMGIVPKENKTEVVWGNEADYSVLMNVVVIDKRLDREGVPDVVVDWLVYKDLCEVLMGFIPERDVHDRKFDEAVSLFPIDKKEEAEWWLARNCIF